jgi:hypothetical protein
MARGHGIIALVWGALFAMFVLGIVTRAAALMGLPFFGVIGVAIYTYRAVDRNARLRYRWMYFLLVGSLLVTAAATVVGAGMTMAGDSEVPGFGLVALGSANVVIGAAAWRALVRPSTRAAAGAGMMAVLLEIIALVVDVMFMPLSSYADRELGLAIALSAAMISIGTGALACFAALTAFEPKRVDVPEARVVPS